MGTRIRLLRRASSMAFLLSLLKSDQILLACADRGLSLFALRLSKRSMNAGARKWKGMDALPPPFPFLDKFVKLPLLRLFVTWGACTAWQGGRGSRLRSGRALRWRPRPVRVST